MVFLIMMLGMITSASAVIFIKLGQIDPVVLSAYRQLLAAFILLPLFIKDLKKQKKAFHLSQIYPSLIPGVFLGFHFISWILGARLVPGAHATLLTTMTPLVMPFVMYFLIRERITLIEGIGSLLSVGGAYYLGARDYKFASEYLMGDLLCFLSMIFLTLYLALARRNRKNTGFWFYMIPLYLTGGVICTAIALIRGADFRVQTNGDWISILGLTIICTVAGHSINNFGMRKIRGQLVSLLNLTQTFFAAILCFLIFGEIPPVYFYPAAVLILSGPLLVIFEKYRREKLMA